MKKIMVVALALFSLLVTLTSCNSKDETTLEKVERKGEMTFAMTGGYPPFNFINDEGELDGFDIDIANALANEMGVEAVGITTAWDGIIGGLLSNRFDTIIGSMAITPQREEKVNFTNPYYYDGAQFFTTSGKNIKSITELKEGKVGVVTGTTYHNALEEMDNIKDIMQFESDVDNIMALEQGRIDGLVTGRFVGLQAPKKFNVDLVAAGSMLYSENIGIAVRKEDKELLEALNNALSAIVEDGTYQKISNKWFNTNILEKQ
ncbi:MAG: transporter substrate-binding domain-containing protein [Sphaerochaetaceae bacterium]|nr:transporter substrate-binding domain-containing protein [Sphaerochaetaceae bacterium]